MQAAVIRYLAAPTVMLVVQHSFGFTVVECLSDDIDLRLGDELTGDWLGRGGSEFVHAGQEHQSFLHGCWGRLDEAIHEIGRYGTGT